MQAEEGLYRSFVLSEPGLLRFLARALIQFLSISIPLKLSLTIEIDRHTHIYTHRDERHQALLYEVGEGRI
jgi:hypothetical protein